MSQPRGSMEKQARNPRTPSSRARLHTWVEQLVGSGLCRPLGGNLFELACSQAELARHLGCSPGSGSVSKRLTSLEKAGLLYSRTPVVFALDRGSGSTPTLTTHDPSTGCGPVLPHPSIQQDRHEEPTAVCGTADRVGFAVMLLARILDDDRADLLDPVIDTLTRLLGGPPEAGSAGDAPDLPETAPQHVSHFRSVPSLTSSLTSSLPTTSVPTSSLPSRATSLFPSSLTGLPGQPVPAPVLPVQPSGRTADAPGPPPRKGGRRPSARLPRDDATRLQVLAPLLEECARRGLPGVSSPSGLLEAFEGYDVEEIERGVTFLRAQLAAHAPLHSPVGLLAHMARTGDLALLGEVPLPATAPTGPGPMPSEVALRAPSEESPSEWLTRMGDLMRASDRLVPGSGGTSEDPDPR